MDKLFRIEYSVENTIDLLGQFRLNELHTKCRCETTRLTHRKSERNLIDDEEHMSIKRTALATLAVCAVLISSPALAQGTKVVKTFSAWTLYSHTGAPGDICFITSQPRETKPADVQRERAYFYVSSWTKDGIRSQISVLLGYDLEDQAPITVTVGSRAFKMFAKGDKGFVGDATSELQLIDAIKRGNFMTVRAKTKDGTETTDTYSLIGATAAVNSLANGCS